MLQLGSRRPHAILPCYVCSSCTAVALRSRAALSVPRVFPSPRCLASKSTPAPSIPPQNKRRPRKPRSNGTPSKSTIEHLKLWRETLDVLKDIQKGRVQGEEDFSSQRPALSESTEPNDTKEADATAPTLSGAFETKRSRRRPDASTMTNKLESPTLDREISYLGKAIDEGSEDPNFLGDKIAVLRSAIQSVVDDKKRDRLNVRLRAIIISYRKKYKKYLSKSITQTWDILPAVKDNVGPATGESLQLPQETLNTDNEEPERLIERVGQAQSGLNMPSTEDSRSKLIDGALAVLTNILASHAKSQRVPGETGSGKSIEKDTRKTAKKKLKKVASEPTAALLKRHEPAHDVAQSLSEVMKEKPVKKGTQDAKPPRSGAKATSKKQPELKNQLGTKKERKTLAPITIETIDAHKLSLTPIDVSQPPVPKLEYGLDRVLFNPGVYHLQDPRSRVYNFDPYLASIMPIHQFDFNALKQYVTSSKDKSLISIAVQHKKKYTGSTSSMTAMLAHFHYLISAWRPINPAHTSRSFNPDSLNYTRIMRAPAAAFLHWKDGTYAIDADKEFDSANVLSMLGKSMEKLLTLPKQDYEKYRLINSDQLTEEQRNADDSYHYTTMGDFMMRSQLDAHDKRLPGSGMFDLKTRAVVSIRMDAKDFHKGVGYEIRRRFGQWESYEREYFDMIRSAFLKYSLQVRMGRMDGIFVAFHNTRRIFGFQYISIDEMDLALHGTGNRSLGDKEFKISLQLLNKALDKATAKFPGKSLRLHIETREGATPFMYIFAKPVEAQEIEAVQTANKKSIEAFESQLLGLNTEDRALEEDEEVEEDLDEDWSNLNDGKYSELAEQDSEEVWQNMRAVVQETMENEALGLESIRDAIRDALDHSGLLRTRSSEESTHYVNALLEALSPGTIAKQTIPDHVSLQEDEDIHDSSKAQESFEEYDIPAGATESANPVTADPKDTTDIETAAEADAPADDHLESPADVEKNKSLDVTSLKDLIVSLATKLETGPSQDIEETVHSDGETQDMSIDNAKLQNFGKILSEIIAKSKDSGVTINEGSSSENGQASAATAQDTADQALAEELQSAESEPEASSSDEEIMGMILTVRNKVNGKYITRPENLSRTDSWVVAYHIEEIPAKRANTIYNQLKKRRQTALAGKEDRNDEWGKMFKGDLSRYSTKGKLFRQKEIEKAKNRPVYVYGQEEPLDYEAIFGKQGA